LLLEFFALLRSYKDEYLTERDMEDIYKRFTVHSKDGKIDFKTFLKYSS
jgi:hypothetical protein